MCVFVCFFIRPPFLWKLTNSDIDDFFFFSLSVAHDAIVVEEVKLQFLMASNDLFVFSFPKVTLSIMQ